MLVNRLAHVCIGAVDLAATERFYVQTLGFAKGFDFLQKGQVVGFYLRVSEGAYVEVFRQGAIPDSKAEPLIRHLCFEVDSIETVSARLTAAGHAVTPKTMGADDSWQAWTADPSGVRIEFHEYTAKSCQRTGAPCVLD